MTAKRPNVAKTRTSMWFDDAILIAAKKKAQDTGVSLAEYCRDVLAADLGKRAIRDADKQSKEQSVFG